MNPMPNWVQRAKKERQPKTKKSWSRYIYIMLVVNRQKPAPAN
jgi:hypothetical protein